MSSFGLGQEPEAVGRLRRIFLVGGGRIGHRNIERRKEMVTRFSNGVRVINCTDKKMFFLDDVGLVPVAPCGMVLGVVRKADGYQTFGAVKLFKRVYEKTEEGLAVIRNIWIEYGDDVQVIGTEEDAKAYRGMVVRPKLVFTDQSFFDTVNFEIY